MSTNYEYAVLGTALLEPKTIPYILKALRREDFSDDFGSRCYDLLSAHRDLAPKDCLSISRGLEEAGYPEAQRILTEAVGLAFPAKLENNCAFVRQDAQKRKFCELAMEVNIRPPEQLFTDINRVFADRPVTRSAHTSQESFADWMERYRKKLADPGAGMCSTGYKKLDECLGGGFLNSGLYVIGARPGMGKTTFCINLANRISGRGDAVFFASLEMPEYQITSKRMAVASGIGYTKLNNATATEGQFDTAMNKYGEIIDKPFYTYDPGTATVADIEEAVREWPDVRCVFIDYLGLIRTSQQNARTYDRITEISGELKRMAKRLDLPVVCVCQLNRSGEHTGEKRPKLSELRDSGSIEQDADGVIFLNRMDYYDYSAGFYPTETEKLSGTIEVIVAKNRHGEANKSISMNFYAASGMITEAM